MSTIVDYIESRSRPGSKPLILSEPSKVWIDRMWHALLDPDVGAPEFDALDALFIDHIDRLGDEQEASLTNGVWLWLVELAEKLYEKGVVCSDCGAPLCPHCGHPKKAAA